MGSVHEAPPVLHCMTALGATWGCSMLFPVRFPDGYRPGLPLRCGVNLVVRGDRRLTKAFWKQCCIRTMRIGGDLFVRPSRPPELFPHPLVASRLYHFVFVPQDVLVGLSRKAQEHSSAPPLLELASFVVARALHGQLVQAGFAELQEPPGERPASYQMMRRSSIDSKLPRG